MVRDRILAAQFGAGDTLDIYYAAFRIPDTIFNLLVLGALSAGFIPIFTSLLHCKDKPCENKEAWIFASRVMNIMGASLFAVSLAAMVFTGPLTDLLAPGFALEKRRATAELTRIMFLSPLFLGASSVIGGVLQSFKRFFVYSLSPIFYNIGIIIGALLLAPIWGVQGLAWGVVIGAVLHMAVQLPLALRLGLHYTPGLGWRTKEIRELGRMMVPRTLSLALSQLQLFAITVIASLMPAGALAVFNFANNLQSFPLGIFGISFAVAAFPALSSSVGNKDKLIGHISQTFRNIMFFIIPSSILIIVLRAQLTRAVLGAGQFSWTDTVRTMDALGFFAAGLFAQAAVPLLIRAFYALKDSATPFYFGLVSVGVGTLLAWALPGVTICNRIIGDQGFVSKACMPLGVGGLALSYSISSVLNLVLLFFYLRWRLGRIDGRRISASLLKIMLASFACAFTAQGMKSALARAGLEKIDTLFDVVLQAVVAGGAGLLVYVLLSYLIRSEELMHFLESAKRRFSWKKVEAENQAEARGI